MLKLCDLSAVRSCLYSVLSTKCEVCRVHLRTGHTSHASSGQDLFVSRKMETDVFMHTPYRILISLNLNLKWHSVTLF